MSDEILLRRYEYPAQSFFQRKVTYLVLPCWRQEEEKSVWPATLFVLSRAREPQPPGGIHLPHSTMRLAIGEYASPTEVAQSVGLAIPNEAFRFGGESVVPLHADYRSLRGDPQSFQWFMTDWFAHHEFPYGPDAVLRTRGGAEQRFVRLNLNETIPQAIHFCDVTRFVLYHWQTVIAGASVGHLTPDPSRGSS